jgi:hypothetical protein
LIAIISRSAVGRSQCGLIFAGTKVIVADIIAVAM